MNVFDGLSFFVRATMRDGSLSHLPLSRLIMVRWRNAVQNLPHRAAASAHISSLVCHVTCPEASPLPRRRRDTSFVVVLSCRLAAEESLNDPFRLFKKKTPGRAEGMFGVGGRPHRHGLSVWRRLLSQRWLKVLFFMGGRTQTVAAAHV